MEGIRTVQRMEEARVKRVLLSLHPFVQRVLQLLQEIIRLRRSKTKATTQIQTLLRLLKDQLGHLCRVLEQVLKEANNGKTSIITLSDAKLQGVLLEYCLQPPMATLKVLLEMQAQDDNHNESSSKLTTLDMELTVCRQIWIQCTQILKQLLDHLDGWSVSQRVQLVQSIVATLPSWIPHQAATLDNNSDTRRVYFQVLTQIASSKSANDDTAKALLQAWPHGSLVARVAETCLESAVDSKTLNTHNTLISSLQCLEFWISQLLTPQPDLWQRLFPGLFHGVFRLVQSSLKDFRQASPARQGMRVLNALCQAVALTAAKETNRNNENYNINHADGPTPTEQANLVQMMNAWKALGDANNLTTSSVDSDNGTKTNAKVISSELFWTRAAQNLALPLSRLVVQASGHESQEIRLESLVLAQLIQISWIPKIKDILSRSKQSTRDVWDKLEEAVLDTCLRLTQDTESSVKDRAQQLVQTCSNDRLMEQRILERWKSVWNDVLGLTMAQQWGEWMSCLYLLQGYLGYIRRRDLLEFLQHDVQAIRLWKLVWSVNQSSLTPAWEDASAEDRMGLPWKFLDRNKLGLLENFIGGIGRKIGVRMSVVLIDDMISRCFHSTATDASEKAVQSVALFEVSRVLLARLAQEKVCRSKHPGLAMLTESILPILVNALSNTFRVGTKYEGTSACLDTAMLQCFSKLCLLTPMNPTSLFPLLSHLSCTKWMTVKHAAKQCIDGVINYHSYGSMGNLIVEYLEWLLATTLTRLRSDQDDELFVTIRTTAKYFRLSTEAFQGEDDVRSKVILSQANEVIESTVSRFDRWSVSAPRNTDMTLTYLDFFDAAIDCLCSSFNYVQGVKDDGIDKSEKERDDWKCVLSEFLVQSATQGTGDIPSNSNDQDILETRNKRIRATKQDTDLVARIVSIATYLLSHPKLLVQSEACILLRKSFSLLFRISQCPAPSDSEEELNGAQNAILRHIAGCWPSLAARTNATLKLWKSESSAGSTLVIVTSGAANESTKLNYGEMRLFVSRVLDLTATMVEVSGDFMATRVREAVWPWASQVLAICLQSTREATEHHSDSFRIVLESALSCTRRIFMHRDTGVPLAGLIPLIGNAILPWLQKSDGIADQAVATMERLILIDRDALFRPLSMLARKPIPRSPFLPGNDPAVAAVQPFEVPNDGQRRALDLLTFLESLPEQPIE